MKIHITPREESHLNCDIDCGLSTEKRSETVQDLTSFISEALNESVGLLGGLLVSWVRVDDDTGETLIQTRDGRRFVVELHEIR